MTLLDVGLLFAALMLVSFTLGASVMWSIEGRDRRQPPLWLVVIRHVSQLTFVAYLVISGEPPTGIITIDPVWWNLMEVFMVVSAIVIFPLEIRQRLRRRQAT